MLSIVKTWMQTNKKDPASPCQLTIHTQIQFHLPIISKNHSTNQRHKANSSIIYQAYWLPLFVLLNRRIACLPQPFNLPSAAPVHFCRHTYLYCSSVDRSAEGPWTLRSLSVSAKRHETSRCTSPRKSIYLFIYVPRVLGTGWPVGTWIGLWRGVSIEPGLPMGLSPRDGEIAKVTENPWIFSVGWCHEK